MPEAAFPCLWYPAFRNKIRNERRRNEKIFFSEKLTEGILYRKSGKLTVCVHGGILEAGFHVPNVPKKISWQGLPCLVQTSPAFPGCKVEALCIEAPERKKEKMDLREPGTAERCHRFFPGTRAAGRTGRLRPACPEKCLPVKHEGRFPYGQHFPEYQNCKGRNRCCPWQEYKKMFYHNRQPDHGIYQHSQHTGACSFKGCPAADPPALAGPCRSRSCFQKEDL